MTPKELALEINKRAIVLDYSEKQFEDAACSYLVFNVWKAFEVLRDKRTAKHIARELAEIIPFEMSFDKKASALAEAVQKKVVGKETNHDVAANSLECLRGFIAQKKGQAAAAEFETAVYKIKGVTDPTVRHKRMA